MSKFKYETKYYDHEDLMEVAKGGYTQGYLDAFSRGPLKDALEEEEELYDFIIYKWSGDGYTIGDILKIAQERAEEEK